MNESTIPLELELRASEIAASFFPNTRYSLNTKINTDCIEIEFRGFFTEEFDPTNRPYQNPTDDYYRNRNADFSLTYFSHGEALTLSGWWRGALLSLHYNTNQKMWQTEDGDEIRRPYPDGDKFESIAALTYYCFT